MRNLTLFLVVVAVIVAIAQLAVLLTSTSPYVASPLQIGAFFTSLFVAFSGLLTLVLYPVKRYGVYKGRVISINSTVRQAALLSLVSTALLFLNSVHLLSAWEAIPLTLAAILTEAFFQADRRSPLATTPTTDEPS